MTPLNNRDSSFVVRIWWEQADTNPGGRRLWRGWVQHTRSGEAAYVQNLEGLLGFIERWPGKLTDISQEACHDTGMQIQRIESRDGKRQVPEMGLQGGERQ